MNRFIRLFLFLVIAVFLCQINADAQIGRRARADRDDNPPGPTGGPGTNWENPPGATGGPGSSPDARPRAVSAPNPTVVRKETVAPPVVVKEEPKPALQVSPVAASFEENGVSPESWESSVDNNKDGVVDVLELQRWHKLQHKIMDSKK
ncbi:MAG TPA: hypothetical protein PLV52_04935 [Candidatus Omnitrophota bacterium]|nr:hypothetical protein [Candidatus Omnitrophota bacterium]